MWKGEVADAGHWSFSDICGVHPQFMPGCGSDNRQTNGSSFDYLPVTDGITIAQAYVTAFFSAYILGHEAADAYLSEQRPDESVTIERRDQFEPKSRIRTEVAHTRHHVEAELPTRIASVRNRSVAARQVARLLRISTGPFFEVVNGAGSTRLLPAGGRR